jgi:geranylgeranyl diphosphate synthase, type II
VSGDIREELKPRAATFEAFLGDMFEVRTRDVPAALRQAMRHSLFAGGKRLRPLLCGLACEAVGGRFGQSLPAGVALEMTHTYSLIHDDLPAMDDDDLRRGRPTCHKVYGDALAILAGDAMQAMAFDVVIGGYHPAVASVMVTELAKGAGAAGMVGGQVLDLIADGKISPPSGGCKPPVFDKESLEQIHRLKTGALFRSTLVMGAYASRDAVEGVDDTFTQSCSRLTDYADAFGLLFQVTDDLLDAEGSEAATGKKTGKDAARGKLTYPGLIGIDASRAKARELAERCVASAEWFGQTGRPLAALARFVELRDR